MPMRDLKALIAAMPAIEAEESLLTVQRLFVGSGNMKPQVSQPILDGWKELMGGASAEPIEKRSTPAAMLAFAQMAAPQGQRVQVKAVPK